MSISFLLLLLFGGCLIHKGSSCMTGPVDPMGGTTAPPAITTAETTAIQTTEPDTTAEASTTPPLQTTTSLATTSAETPSTEATTVPTTAKPSAILKCYGISDNRFEGQEIPPEKDTVIPKDPIDLTPPNDQGKPDAPTVFRMTTGEGDSYNLGTFPVQPHTGQVVWIRYFTSPVSGLVTLCEDDPNNCNVVSDKFHPVKSLSFRTKPIPLKDDTKQVTLKIENPGPQVGPVALNKFGIGTETSDPCGEP